MDLILQAIKKFDVSQYSGCLSHQLNNTGLTGIFLSSENWFLSGLFPMKLKPFWVRLRSFKTSYSFFKSFIPN